MVVGCHDEHSIYSFAAPVALVWAGILRMRRNAICQKSRHVFVDDCDSVGTSNAIAKKRILKITLVISHSAICAVYDIAYTAMLLVGGS